MALTDEQIDAQLRALRNERAGYEAQGKADRARQVDEQIALLSGEPAPDTGRTRLRRTAAAQTRTRRG